MNYTPVGIINKIERKRQEHVGLVTNIYTDNAKVRICPPNKKGERHICVHFKDEEMNKFSTDGYTYYSITADRKYTIKDSLKNIIEDIDREWVRL